VKTRVLKYVERADTDQESRFRSFPRRALESLPDTVMRSACGICKPANPRSCRLSKVAATILFLILVFAAPTNMLLAQNLYVIERDDFYGFSDKSGTPVIPPRYGLVKPFSEGLAPVYVSGTWGFIDSEGNMKKNRSSVFECGQLFRRTRGCSSKGRLGLH